MPVFFFPFPVLLSFPAVTFFQNIALPSDLQHYQDIAIEQRRLSDEGETGLDLHYKKDPFCLHSLVFLCMAPSFAAHEAAQTSAKAAEAAGSDGDGHEHDEEEAMQSSSSAASVISMGSPWDFPYAERIPFEVLGCCFLTPPSFFLPTAAG